MTKLEQMQERASETLTSIHFNELDDLLRIVELGCMAKDKKSHYKEVRKRIQKLDDKFMKEVTEVWNEAIKECEGCVPREVVLGKLLGYRLSLISVPEYRAPYVEKYAKRILKAMEEKYHGEVPDISIINDENKSTSAETRHYKR